MRRSRNYKRKKKALLFEREVIAILENLREKCLIGQQEEPGKYWKEHERTLKKVLEGCQSELKRCEERLVRAQFRGRNTAKRRGLL